MNEKPNSFIVAILCRTDGDIVSHTSTEEAVVESVLALSALNERAISLPYSVQFTIMSHHESLYTDF